MNLPLMPVGGGAATTLAAQRGQVMLVNFWATWCVPCRYELPEMAALEQRLHTRGFRVLAITAETEREPIAAFIKRLGVTVTALMDKDSALHAAVSVKVMPSTLLLNRQGEVVKTYQGFDRRIGIKPMEDDVLALLEIHP
ncbi:MAG: TlpA family protein disulfide reductase [Deltaproteobacteria bacterium]|nr:TlpA family protein disulfide reductase [Deltaproteobacteria bacterium]